MGQPVGPTECVYLSVQRRCVVYEVEPGAQATICLHNVNIRDAVVVVFDKNFLSARVKFNWMLEYECCESAPGPQKLFVYIYTDKELNEN